MGVVLSKSAIFVGIIVLGYLLKKVGFFKESDFGILSKIVLKITLPASVVYNFCGMVIKPSMFVLVLLGFAIGVIYMIVGYCMNLKESKQKKAYDVLNLPGYNIGIFSMPFVTSFLGPTGVVVTSLFDVGNSIVCLGGAYSIASVIRGDTNGVSIIQILKKLFSSVPFISYITMTVLCTLQVKLPAVVFDAAEIIGKGNVFIAMLMIGVGFHLYGDPEKRKTIIKIVAARYILATLVALFVYFILPFPLEWKQTLVLLAYSPIPAMVPAFTAEMKEDVGLSSAINSICILISICCMVAVLTLIM